MRADDEEEPIITVVVEESEQVIVRYGGEGGFVRRFPSVVHQKLPRGSLGWKWTV